MMIRVLAADETVAGSEIRDALGEGGMFEVTCLSDGLEAYTEVVRIKPHLCLLSLTLPNVSGYEIYRELRGHPSAEIRNTSAVFLADVPLEDFDLPPMGKDRGSSLHVLSRPLDKAKLIEAVETYAEGDLNWERFDRRIQADVQSSS